MAQEVTMRVPQFGRTIPSFEQGEPEGPRYGRILTQDRDGNSVDLAEIMQTDTYHLARMFPFAPDRTLQTASKMTQIDIRINWPGYTSWYGQVRMGSLGDIVRHIGLLLRQFLAEAPKWERPDQREDNRAWNVTANNLTIRDFKLVAINHYKNDVFYCDFDRIMVRGFKPRPF